MFEATSVSKKVLKIVFSDPFKADEFDKVFSIIIAILEKGVPIAIIADMRATSRVPLDTASRLKAWMRKNAELFRKNLVCTAVLMNNTATNMLIRQLLKGVFLVQRPVSPNGMFVSEAKCLAWVDASVKKRENNVEIGDGPDVTD